MKIRLLALLLTLAIFSGCSALQQEKVSQWWNSPGTQAGKATVERLAISFAQNVALSFLQQWAGGGPIDPARLAISGGAGMLYTQANYIRDLQGTNQVLNPVAMANALEAGGTTKEISQKLAQQLYDNAVAAMHQANLSPDKASELNAAGLDAAAAKVGAADPSADLFK